MSHFNNSARKGSHFGRKLLTVWFAAGVMSIATTAYCDQSFSMAPPVQSNGGYADAAGSSVFNWQEIPQNQNVPIQNAVFDQGGYQLFDTSGETIVVPFVNNNLYVMKFAVSDDGNMYFVNSGTAPILYLPEDGYLSNSSDAGGHWYPFTQQWHPSSPVFIGIAPSWNDYVGMGWYPNMAYHGGYWSSQPSFSVGAVFPSSGLFIQIGGAQIGGWGQYSDYDGSHSAPYHMAIVNQNVYVRGGSRWQQYSNSSQPFYGGGRPYVYGKGFVTIAPPAGSSRRVPATVNQRFQGGYSGANSTPGSSHRFQGASPSTANAPTFQGTRAASTNHVSQSSRGTTSNHTFQGGSSGRPANSTSHTNGASHSAPAVNRSTRGGQSNSSKQTQQNNR
jgi:hypothetical protein